MLQGQVNGFVEFLFGVDHKLREYDHFETRLHCQIELEVAVAGRMAGCGSMGLKALTRGFSLAT